MRCVPFTPHLACCRHDSVAGSLVAGQAGYTCRNQLWRPRPLHGMDTFNASIAMLLPFLDGGQAPFEYSFVCTLKLALQHVNTRNP